MNTEQLIQAIRTLQKKVLRLENFLDAQHSFVFANWEILSHRERSTNRWYDEGNKIDPDYDWLPDTLTPFADD